MKIVDLQVIPFRVSRTAFRNGQIVETTIVQTLTKIVTDSGIEGYYFGGRGHGDQDGLQPDERAALTSGFKSMLVGQDPFDREKFWHWMWVCQMLPENLISVVDMALWDLKARAMNVPIHKLLGGCRDKIKAYASTYPNMGQPEDYAKHAAECKAQGYKAYKIHPYYFWNPVTQQPDPGRPSHIEQDLEVCRAVRDKVGSDMVLMYDPAYGL